MKLEYEHVEFKDEELYDNETAYLAYAQEQIEEQFLGRVQFNKKRKLWEFSGRRIYEGLDAGQCHDIADFLDRLNAEGKPK